LKEKELIIIPVLFEKAFGLVVKKINRPIVFFCLIDSLVFFD
jgi:hypothetical protein